MDLLEMTEIYQTTEKSISEIPSHVCGIYYFSWVTYWRLFSSNCVNQIWPETLSWVLTLLEHFTTLLCFFKIKILFIYLLKFIWLTMLCYFKGYSKVIQFYIHIYLYLFFFRFFSIIDYYKILNIVPWAIQQVFVVYFIYGGFIS